jgi:serine/threonine protein kinase
MDPLPFYYEVLPVTGGVITPQPKALPTLLGISQTTYPTPVTSDATLIPSSTPPASAEKTGNGQPTDFLVGELIVLLVAGAIVLIIFRQLKHKESKQEALFTSKETTSPQKISRTSPRVSSAATIPEAGTAVSGIPRTYTSIAEQMNYFPNELESKYTEIKYIGRGGIAWVFSARRKSDAMMVAVKIPISFDEMTGKSFLNEIAAWETLRHPNIVKVTAVNILPVPFVEMEYVPDALEAIEKPIPVWKAVHLIRGIADGLKYAHEQGFIHRDIKPHNILLDKDFVPKITDWGMSKVLANEVKKSSIAGFSLSYAAPEQVSPSEFGRTDERTDIYQLGVVFYELVTGSVPFGGESIVEVGNAILREQPIPPSEFNSDAAVVEKIILKCLEKDPAKRYQSSAELLDALHGYLDEEDE